MIPRPALVLLASLAVLSGGTRVVHAAAPARVPTEVVVVATQHFISDMPDGYTPGHLRALLEKVRPDVVAVEACTNVDDPWMTAPYELAKVTRPWAIAKKVKVIPIGWSVPNYGVQIGAMISKIAAAGNEAAYQQLEQEFQKSLAEHTLTCERMNDDRALEIWRDYHAKLHELSGGETPWEQWNSKIADKLLAVCREHSGKRVAVVFGGAHAYYFRDCLAEEPGIRILATKDFFPLTENEVRNGTKFSDYLEAMRLLNFEPGSLAAPQLVHLEMQLKKLAAVEEYQSDFQYFSARLFLHQHEPGQALKILADLCELEAGVLLAFDGTTSVRDASRLQTYFARAQLGTAESALETLRELAGDDTASVPIRQTAEALLKASTPETAIAK